MKTPDAAGLPEIIVGGRDVLRVGLLSRADLQEMARNVASSPDSSDLDPRTAGLHLTCSTHLGHPTHVNYMPVLDRVILTCSVCGKFVAKLRLHAGYEA